MSSTKEISDKEVYQSARVFINQHGEDALIEAMHKVEYYNQTNNQAGVRIWQRIADAIEFIQMPDSLKAEQIH